MTVVFSGGGTAGHFHPAVAVADALALEAPALEPYFVGARGRLEARELPATGYPHRLLPVRGLRRPAARPGAGAPARFASALTRRAADLGALLLLAAATLRLLPDFRRRGARAVVLTGGYASAPAGLAARVLGLPIVVQEQNAHPGRTTRLFARWARQVHLAHPEAVERLRPRARARARVTGNPIRPLPPAEERSAAGARAALGLPADGRVALVVGGSQGALGLNRAVIEALSRRLPARGDVVFWVTGPAHRERVERALAAVERGGVVLASYLSPERMYRALAAADVAVSRAGAMATSEFLAWGLPAILVPLPTAADDHQSANARALEAAGAAVHLPERDASGRALTGERLWARVARLLDSPERRERMSRAALRRARPDAAARIAADVARLLGQGATAADGGAASARGGGAR